MIPPRLFPPPIGELAAGLAALEGAMARVQPLRGKHRAALPGGIRRLSDWLTVSRDDLPRDYLSRPENLSAYLHYFLPWNVYRQGRLLQGLDLDLPEGARVVDLGAGPLTFLLALWCGVPRSRRRPLEYVAIDRSGPAMKAGAALFVDLAPQASWRVRTERAIVGGARTPPADLLVLANFLNEVDFGRTRGGDDEDDDAYIPLLERWRAGCTPAGRVLLIEPGTRPAARRLASLRKSALRSGWSVEAPCPHAGDCPQPGVGRGPWCHFTFAPEGVPPWLMRLGTAARLPKDRASLSFLLLRPPLGDGTAAPAPAEDQVRVVSEAFPLAEGGSGRYACTARGLALLAGAEPPHRPGPAPGDAVTITWPERPGRDAKSGALLVPATEGRRRGR